MITLNVNGAVIELEVVVVDFGASAHAIVASERVPFFPNPPAGTSCTPTAPCGEGVNILVELQKDVYSRR
jgi:hypothetical protein